MLFFTKKIGLNHIHQEQEKNPIFANINYFIFFNKL